MSVNHGLNFNQDTTNGTGPTGMFDRPSSAKQQKPGERHDDQRFDAVAFRHTSGLARPPDEPMQPRAPQIDHTARYVAAWAGLGLISAAYLGGLSLQRAGNFEGALVPVTETLERLATDIADLKQTTAALDVRERATSDRVAATETRLEGFAQIAAHAPQAVLPQATQGQRPTNRAVLAETPAALQVAAAPIQRMAGVELTPAPVAPAASLADPLKPHRQNATPAGAVAPSAKPVAVATIRPAPALPSAASITTTTNPINTGSVPARAAGLLVASGPSLDSIRLSWTVLNQNHGAVLGSLEPRILPSGDGSAFQLIAGPFATDADAQKACGLLKARGVGCKAADYAGAPL